jgi:hypothetical protein
MVNLNVFRGGFAHRRCAEWGLFLGYGQGAVPVGTWKYVWTEVCTEAAKYTHQKGQCGFDLDTTRGIQSFLCGASGHELSASSLLPSFSSSLLFFAAHMNRSPSTTCSGLDPRRFGLPSTDIPPPRQPARHHVP